MINCVFHLLYQVFDGISICDIDGVYILQRNIFSGEQKLAYILLSFTHQIPHSYLIQLWIFIHHASFHPLHHNHDTKDAFMCYLVPLFLPVRFNSLQYTMRYRDTTKRAASPALPCTQTHIFVSKMFLTRKSITKRRYWMLYTKPPMSVYYKKTGTPCCDLPKQNTSPLFLFTLNELKISERPPAHVMALLIPTN